MPLHGCGVKRPRDYGPRAYSDRACAGGKPAAHPLHGYITYEKRRFPTRYMPLHAVTRVARMGRDLPQRNARVAKRGGNRQSPSTNRQLPRITLITRMCRGVMQMTRGLPKHSIRRNLIPPAHTPFGLAILTGAKLDDKGGMVKRKKENSESLMGVWNGDWRMAVVFRLPGSGKRV